MRTLLIILSLGMYSLFAVSCGGGGGGGEEEVSPAIPYSGVETPADLTVDNSVDLAVGAYMGMLYADQQGGVASSSKSPPGEQEAPLPAPSANAMCRQIVQGIASQSLGRATGTAAARSIAIDEREFGCSGYADVKGSVDDSTREFNLNVTYHDFSEDCGETMTGRTNEKGALTPDLNVAHITITYEALLLDDGELQTTQSGTMFFDYQVSPVQAIIDMVMRNETTGKTYWMRDYNASMAPVLGSSDSDLDISGRYYDPDHGYVDLTTPIPLRLRYDEDFPYQGSMELDGASNRSILLGAITPILFDLVGDFDGDGEFDDYDWGIKHWPGQNTLPIADAGADISVVINCLAELDGSGSSDFDEDPLAQFNWTIIDSPPSSAAALSSTDTATTSIIPDVPGVYLISLTVYDGYDVSVADTVTVTVSDGFFCSWQLSGVYIDARGGEIAVGDLNGDGRTDVAVTASYYGNTPDDNRLLVFLQEPGGGLVTPVTYQGGNGESLAIGDVNGDEKDDVVVTMHDGFGVFYQNDSGMLDAMVFHPSPNSFFSQVRLGDLNNDGRTDAAIVQNVTDGIDVFYQNISGGFEPPESYILAPFNINGLQIGDIDGDGLDDAVLFNMAPSLDNPEVLAVMSQDITGGLKTPVLHKLDHAGNSWGVNEVTIGDLDRDGRNDVLTTFGVNTPNAFLGVFYQELSGTLAPPVVYQGYDAPGPVALHDFDNNSVDEVVVGNGWISITLYRQDGSGGLLPYIRYPLLDITPYVQPDHFAIGDITGDGVSDIVMIDNAVRLAVFSPSF